MKILNIYTDGSHLDKQNKGRLGCGGVAIDFSKPKGQRIVGEYQQELTKDFMKFSYGTDDCSNPTAEMMGVYCALVHFKKDIKKYDKVIFHADYMGVSGWMGGSDVKKPWKINESYIQKIKDDIDSEIKEQGLSGKIDFK